MVLGCVLLAVVAARVAPPREGARPAVADPDWAAGKLARNEILRFSEALPWLRYVRTHGVQQFISIYERLRGVTGDELLWGDEIEYQLLTMDHAQRTVKLSLRARPNSPCVRGGERSRRLGA